MFIFIFTILLLGCTQEKNSKHLVVDTQMSFPETNNFTGIVFSDNSYYLIDYMNPTVQQFSLDGNYKRAFGSYGSGPGELNGVLDFWALEDVNIIYDPRLVQLNYYRKDGTYIKTVKTDQVFAKLGVINDENLIGYFAEDMNSTTFYEYNTNTQRNVPYQKDCMEDSFMAVMKYDGLFTSFSETNYYMPFYINEIWRLEGNSCESFPLESIHEIPELLEINNQEKLMRSLRKSHIDFFVTENDLYILGANTTIKDGYSIDHYILNDDNIQFHDAYKIPPIYKDGMNVLPLEFIQENDKFCVLFEQNVLVKFKKP